MHFYWFLIVGFFLNPWNSKEAEASASFVWILGLKVFNSIKDAVSNYNYLIATSARQRFLTKPHKNNFSSLFKEINGLKKIGILFGPENSGLSNDDLKLCDCIFSIPISMNNSSLNLSHSVLIIAYKKYKLEYYITTLSKKKKSAHSIN